MRNSLIAKLISFLRRNLRSSKKGLINKLYFLFRIFFARKLGLYPFPIRNEIGSIKEVLISGNWNTTYSLNTKVVETEENFSNYLDIKHCILVPSGGVGIEILMRLMKVNSSSVTCNHIRHICPATPFSILRAGVAPIPTNPSRNPFYLPPSIFKESNKDKLVLSSHLWGYPEDIRPYISDYLIEDSCLSFESYFPDGRHVGTLGKAGVFSFGCLKPIQAGEGGLICTNDDSLAREIRIMQNYANEVKITGSNDVKRFGLNGRISCLSSAIICEQLKKYKEYVNKVRKGVKNIKNEIEKRNLPLNVYIPKNYKIEDLGFSSVLIEVEPKIYKKLMIELSKNGIETIPTFFDDLFTLTYFQKNILNELNKKQKEIYLSNFLDSNKYRYPERFISISRRWIANSFMRQIFLNALYKSLDTISR